ncbi:histidine kinase [Streptomyces spectabilis]|uniref:Histidine kinase n=1 Tax=Streptomyces spectabilis TaxID=68270 RepID=A0A516R9S5_STRST|nr:histidine kinase [Streptomyces spectabilis]
MTATLPYAAPATASEPARRPGFWRAPVSAGTFREFGYTLTNLPFAIAGFVFAVTLFSLGAGLAVTLLGIPVYAAMLAGARGLGAVERRRARTRLGLAVEDPAAARTPREGGAWARAWARLADAAGWKALLFQVVMFPWRVASFCVAVTLWVTGWAVALFPAYSWVFERYLDWPGYRVYDFTSGGEHHAYYIESPWQVAGVSGLGILLVLLTPLVIRALNGVDRAAVRSLLGR